MNHSTQPIAGVPGLTRRGFVQTCAVALAATSARPLTTLGVPQDSAPARQVPLKLGLRAATMRMVGDYDVIATAVGVPGIRGVELQATAGRHNLRDWEAVRHYKRESNRWDVRIPSLAGIWDKGVNISSPKAVESLQLTVRAAEMLGSSVILAAFFNQSAPDMSREDSYGPVVANLKQAAPGAADAGVVIGLETSLSPADNAKLVDLVGHPAVRVYYDVYNMATFGHGSEAVPGVKLLGKDRICAVHVKNGDRLIEEPGPIDWAAAFAAFNEIGYEGWFTYETSHKSTSACLTDTARNSVFLAKHIRMPVASA
jgi:L-ribulose-5-phosphate 3-epimerase